MFKLSYEFLQCRDCNSVYCILEPTLHLTNSRNAFDENIHDLRCNCDPTVRQNLKRLYFKIDKTVDRSFHANDLVTLKYYGSSYDEDKEKAKMLKLLNTTPFYLISNVKKGTSSGKALFVDCQLEVIEDFINGVHPFNGFSHTMYQCRECCFRYLVPLNEAITDDYFSVKQINEKTIEKVFRPLNCPFCQGSMPYQYDNLLKPYLYKSNVYLYPLVDTEEGRIDFFYENFDRLERSKNDFYHECVYGAAIIVKQLRKNEEGYYIHKDDLVIRKD